MRVHSNLTPQSLQPSNTVQNRIEQNPFDLKKQKQIKHSLAAQLLYNSNRKSNKHIVHDFDIPK